MDVMRHRVGPESHTIQGFTYLVFELLDVDTVGRGRADMMQGHKVHKHEHDQHQR